MRASTLLFGLFSAVVFAAPGARAQTVTLTVPDRGASVYPVTHLTLHLDVAPGAGGADPTINLAVQDPTGNASPTILTPGGSLSGLTFGSGVVVATYASGDRLTVTPPAGAGLSPGDPGRYRYILSFRFSSDYDPATCARVGPPGPQTWQITMDGASVAGGCALSLAPPPGAPCADPPVLINDGHPVASLGGADGLGAQTCAGARGAARVMMVLDRSCSMAAKADPTDTSAGAPRRIDALASAANTFVLTWEALRATEGANAPAGDQLGIVYFDTDARWMNQVGVAAWSSSPNVSVPATALRPFSTIRPELSPANFGQVSPSGATSIGDGLFEAANALGAAASRNVVLLMSDGLENANRRVSTVSTASGPRIKLHSSGQPASAGDDLPNADALRIYAVTLGAETTVAGHVNQALAEATGGFYVNGTDGTQLPLFFTHILEDFLRFSTYQTALIERAAIGPAPQELRFHLGAGTRAAVLTLASPRPVGFRGEVTPPGGGRPIIVGPGAHPLPAAPGEWVLRLTSSSGGIAAPLPTEGAVDAVVVTDDMTVKVETEVVKGDHAVGDRLRLEARITSFGEPFAGAGSRPGEVLRVRVLEPGEALGELLSNPNIATGAPFAGDTMSAANAKLHHLMDGKGLPTNSRNLELRDDGQGADRIAGDGVYTASHTADLPGHHHFLFVLEVETPEGGRLSRRSLESAHVRAFPGGGSLQLTAADAGIFTFTPKLPGGQRLGPGWAPYFVFVPPGGSPVRPEDRLDGTYAVNLPPGTDPGRVTGHFLPLNELLSIDDPIPPLPEGSAVGCGDGSKPPCGQGPGGGGVPGIGSGLPWWLILVVLVVLVVVVLLRRKSSP